MVLYVLIKTTSTSLVYFSQLINFKYITISSHGWRYNTEGMASNLLAIFVVDPITHAQILDM